MAYEDRTLKNNVAVFPIRFLRPYGRYQASEIASFKAHERERILALGVAEPVDEEEMSNSKKKPLPPRSTAMESPKK